DERQIASVGGKGAAVRFSVQLRGVAGGAYAVFGPWPAIAPGLHAQFAGLVAHLVPAQPILAGRLAQAPLAHSVDEQFGFVAGGEYMHRSDLAFAPRPGPVRQQVRHRQLRAPARLVQVIAVLRETGQVDDARIRYLDGRPVIDRWQESDRLHADSVELPLQGGHAYDLRVEYFDGERDAGVRLAWQ